LDPAFWGAAIATLEFFLAMAELIVSEKLQPCLLDRLTDDEPKKTEESRDQRVISLRRYRQGVLRDLEWLFGASAHLSREGTDSFSIEEFPDARNSVINFGTRHLFGVSSANLTELRRSLTEALKTFEPRIIENTLRVGINREGHEIVLDVEADLWAAPMVEHLHFKTKLDLESGYCSVTS
jgi:type VI secretion system protein ImpF